MSNFPNQFPVSTTSNPNGDGTNVQDPIPISDHDAQPPNPVVVDGIRSNYSTQPTEPSRPTFASTIKLGLGSHGSDFKSTLDSKSGPQHGFPQPSGNLLKGASSEPSTFTPPSVTSPLTKIPEESILEFSACYLIGKIWGESVPMAAIIHRTRNEGSSLEVKLTMWSWVMNGF